MQTILQLSDFHIAPTTCTPQTNKVFMGLVAELKRLSLQNCVLIYNGDVIDFTTINNSIDASLSDLDKSQKWEEEAEKAYSRAKEYFDVLTSELAIPNDHIIICCGNHDVNVYAEGSEHVSCPDSKNRVMYSSQRFLQFAKFCDTMQLKKKTTGTYFREIGNLNFLVVNSNWRNKWCSGIKQSLCIACNEIRDIIESKKEKLISTKREKGKVFNIYVCHAPSADYCEESLYPYKENGREAILDTVDQYFGLRLFGDKHTDSVHNFEYIVGAPLTDNVITCGIHEFDDEYHHHHRSLQYLDGNWSIVGSEEYIGKILSISISSLKRQALEYLFGSRDTSELEHKIIDFDKIRSSTKWRALDRLIRASADIQKPQKVGAGLSVDVKDGFINTLTRLIADSKSKVAITVRGEARVGKSVCMSTLYLNLLHRFVCGTFEYVPVYIDLEQLQSSASKNIPNRDTKRFVNTIRDQFSKILKNGIELATQLQRPACCIIDGLNKYYLYSYAKIEEVIAQELEGRFGKQYKRLVYCIDSGRDCGLGSTPQHTKKDAEHVVYFNRILTQKVNAVKKYRTFIKSFCELKDASLATADQVISNIEQMNILEVDTSLLVNFWEQISEPTELTFFQMIDAYVQDCISIANFGKAAQAAYMYWVGENYTTIKCKCGIPYEVLELIRTQRIIMKYLLAANYVLHIQNASTDPQSDSSLNVLYSHEICAFIREYICKNQAQAQVLNYAEAMYSKLTPEGQATITYLIGRIDYDKRKIGSLLHKWRDTVHCDETGMTNSIDIHKYVARRSITISELYVDSDSHNLLRNYIDKLITSRYDRMINRIFYLQFYGDRSFDDTEEIIEGFDIYYTYNLLASRLNKWRKDGDRYILLELELFTLCDLIQMRIDTPRARSSNKSDMVPSFFYSTKYNQPKDDMAVNVISFMMDTVENYLDIFGNASDNAMFIQYLNMQLDNFRNVQKKLVNGCLNSEDDRYKPNKLLKQLQKLDKVNRVGWFFEDVISDTITEDAFKAMQNARDPKETTLIHVFESYLIGLLYLPDKVYDKPYYNKDKILKIILLHDLGETCVGDIIPQYENYSKARDIEKEFGNRLYLQGVHPGVSDLSDCFNLWQEWCKDNSSDINIMIAKEIDRIQMLYKMLTLLSDNRISLSAARVQDFWQSKNKILSVEGKCIFNMLIVEGEFGHIAAKYGISISHLR